jgi:hydrogenase maturation protease
MDLVIGIGNSLRRDDGIGPQVARALEGRPSVSVVAVQGLVPELVLRLRVASRVLFVDSVVGAAGVRLEPVAAKAQGSGHDLEPSGLLALALEAFGKAPEAWTLSVPGTDFGYGEEPSDRGASFLPAAVAAATDWLGRA